MIKTERPREKQGLRVFILCCCFLGLSPLSHWEGSTLTIPVQAPAESGFWR